MKKKINKLKGILFFITGLSGSGKSTLGKLMLKNIIKNFGPTILIHGDDFRKVYDFNFYSKEQRLKFGCQNTLLIKKILDQKINVIYTAVSLSHKSQNFKRKNIQNYIEIFLKAPINKIIKFKKKKLYHKKTTNIVGVDIKPEFPRKPNIQIHNDFKKPMVQISENLTKKIVSLIS